VSDDREDAPWPPPRWSWGDVRPDAEAVPDDDAVSGEVIPWPGPLPDFPPYEPDADPGAAPPPAPVLRKAKPGEAAELRPLLPPSLRSRAEFAKAVRWRAKRWRHISLYHLLRLPHRGWLTLKWGIFGAAALELTLMAWWHVAEQTDLRSEAVRNKDARTWLQLDKHAKKSRFVRGMFLLAGHVTLIVGGLALTYYAPLGWIPAALVLLPVLAMFGRPAHKPIHTAATVPVAYDELSFAVIVRALGALGIGEMNKALKSDPANACRLVDPITRDGNGWLARLDLPHGVTAADVSDKREELASGLRRQLGCVWPETDHKRHPGALSLFVADQEMAEAGRPPWKLARRGTADVFAPVEFGTDPRGRSITVTLMFANVIIGSIPRMGKTFLLRLLLMICALDPRVEIHAYDLKGTGDLSPLKAVAHRYGVGDEPEDIEALVADLRKVRSEMRRRARVIRELPEERCPENKITPELAGDRKLGLHPVAVALDETQIAFEHSVYGAEIAEICIDLTKRGPALGIMLFLATQRPDKNSIPTPISANAILRMCLKVMGQIENDMVLGTSMYKAGYRATMFSRDDKGILYFGGEGLNPLIVWAHGFDAAESKVICLRARSLREAAGTLTGHALGEDDADEVRSIAADVLTVFRGDPKLYLTTIADRLRESIPSAYADITPEAVRSQLAGVGVAGKRVREPGGAPLAGVELASVMAVVGNPGE
jgi:DNA segregation ATPase FtsK/SpoIIIE, S-DNA-T family